jgi:hypothetical protein
MAIVEDRMVLRLLLDDKQLTLNTSILVKKNHAK